MEEIESYINKYRLDTNEKGKALVFSCETDSNDNIILDTGRNDYLRVCILVFLCYLCYSVLWYHVSNFSISL